LGENSRSFIYKAILNFSTFEKVEANYQETKGGFLA